MVAGSLIQVLMTENIPDRVVAFAEKIMSVIQAAPRNPRRTTTVMIAAEKCGLTRAERRWWRGMSTIAREPPRSTMSITDQKTMMVTVVIMPMMMNVWVV